MQHPGTHNSIGRAVVSDSTIVQVGYAENVTFPQGASAPDAYPPGTDDPWVELARTSSVWNHIPGSRDAEAWRHHTAAVAARLSELRDEAERRLSGDPWQDPGFAQRFAERVEWLLGEPGQGDDLDLYPAEAALLVLAPLLYRVHVLRAADARSVVEPWQLVSRPGSGRDRASFEAFASDHALLVQRALLRPESAAAIGWWLFHRWLVRHGDYADPALVADLLGAVGEPAAALGDVLAPHRVSALLHGLRRGPDVCNTEYLDGLATDDRLRGPGHQRVRDQRLVLLTALAFAVSVEMTTLPDVVAEHLGIPHPVDLPQLRHTLDGSSWGGAPELPVLRADCAHEAVVEGLRVYTARADELLHTVSRTARSRVNHPMPPLPGRLSADGVRPAEGAFTGWAGFRLDERRIRDLLMGVQLYKDPDLAVRELYQNALDACRYRRARTAYLDRTHADATFAYDGRISFVQDVDEDGREYLECRDNGIGMGDAELRGVFSQAGARFAEQQDFQEERAAWGRLDPPVAFYPNSRFGIGVLSYFMLADEIRVTTCRMGPTGDPGPVLEASICGPGHLFRIVERAERGERPGTAVRLYLRLYDTDEASPRAGWSSPAVLRRLLAIAEFPTEARHGDSTATWRPGELRPRKQPRDEAFGLHAHGELLPCPGTPHSAQVIWCENGGGLLVDGLVVQPSVLGGVLGSRTSGLTGAVVNLTGPYAPERLSADRAEVLDDLRDTVRRLVSGAVAPLVSRPEPLLTFEWVAQVAEASAPLADVIAAACIAARRPIRYLTLNESVDIARTGCLPADASLALPKIRYSEKHRRTHALPHRSIDQTPDHILLWRQLAHHAHPPALAEFVGLCPELADTGPLLPALPSDHALLWLSAGLGTRADHRGIMQVVNTAARLGRSPREVALRAAALRLHDLPVDAFPDVPVPTHATENVSREILARIASRTPQLPVTVADLVHEAARTGATVSRVAALWSEEGREVADAVRSTATALEQDEELFLHLTGYRPRWLTPGAEVHPGDLADHAQALGVPAGDLCARLTRCGMVADGAAWEGVPLDGAVLLLTEDLDEEGPWLSRTEPVPPRHVLRAAERWNLTPVDAAARYARLGFVPPVPLPPLTSSGDLVLVTDQADAYDEETIIRTGRPVSYLHLLIAAERLDIPPWEAAARLREYGITVPLRKPGRHDALDEQLFSPHGPLNWYGVTTATPFPFAHIIHAARAQLTDPDEIAARLLDWGIELSCPGLPHDLSHPNALTLLTNEDDEPVTVESHITLGSLLRLACEMQQPLGRVHSWLVQLGIPTVDPSEAVRAALPRIPLAPTGPPVPARRRP